MRRLNFLLAMLGVLFLSGCYEKKVLDAYKKLEVGMSKKQIDVLFGELKFIKEQKVLRHADLSDDHMRGSLVQNHSYGDRQPENLFDHVTFDGSTKVYSYLIKSEYRFPFTYMYYVAIFYNEKEDKVVGKVQMSTDAEPRVWGDKF